MSYIQMQAENNHFSDPGLLKNTKNQPLMAKLVTSGQPNSGQLIKVLSTSQGQPIFGKLTPGGLISKPLVAKYTNAQGQPLYSMNSLDGEFVM